MVCKRRTREECDIEKRMNVLSLKRSCGGLSLQMRNLQNFILFDSAVCYEPSNTLLRVLLDKFLDHVKSKGIKLSLAAVRNVLKRLDLTTTATHIHGMTLLGTKKNPPHDDTKKQLPEDNNSNTKVEEENKGQLKLVAPPSPVEKTKKISSADARLVTQLEHWQELRKLEGEQGTLLDGCVSECWMTLYHGHTLRNDIRIRCARALEMYMSELKDLLDCARDMSHHLPRSSNCPSYIS